MKSYIKSQFKKKIKLKNLISLLIFSLILSTGCFYKTDDNLNSPATVNESDSNQSDSDQSSSDQSGSDQSDSDQSGSNNNYIPGIKSNTGNIRLTHNNFLSKDKNGKRKRCMHLFNIRIKGILITITSIEVYSETEGWTEIVNYGARGKTIDLMQFKNDNTAEISYFNLKPDIYSKLRLHLTRESILVIEKNGSYYLKRIRVPSKIDPEIKIIGSFDVEEAGLTSITVKFDPYQSIHFTPGKCFMFIPTFRIIAVDTTSPVTETISSENGGEINVFGEFSAQIPAGAFPQDEDVTLALIGMPVIMPFSSTFIIGNAYEMGPLETHLGMDMTLVMYYQDSEIEQKEVDESSLDIYYFDDSQNDWFRTSGTMDNEYNTITTSVDTFTMFSIGGLPLTAPIIEPAIIVNAGASEVPYKVRAQIIDPDGDGISNAILYFREAGDFSFEVVDMTVAGDDYYEAVIPLTFLRDQLSPTGIEVFIESADNTGDVSYAPVTSSAAPHPYSYNPDADTDGMNDRWEVENGLDITTDDSMLDPDNDGFTNIEEYQNGTDPQVAESVPVPEDIDSTCAIQMQSHIWQGDTYDFAIVNSTITVIPPNSAEEFSVEWDISFSRLYLIVEGNNIIFVNKTDSVSGDTGSLNYTEPSVSVILYDDYLHIDEFYTIINGKPWNPLPEYDDFVVDYTAEAWNSSGGSYSEDFNFSF